MNESEREQLALLGLAYSLILAKHAEFCLTCHREQTCYTPWLYSDLFDAVIDELVATQ